MILNEKIETISDTLSGYFSIKTVDKSGKEEIWEEKNLVMDNARNVISKLLSGFNSGKIVNTFKLGVDGNVTGDLLTPKTSSQGFISSRTQLFSETNATSVYRIRFAPAAGLATQTLNTTNTTDGVQCTVSVTVSSNVVTYVVTIPEGAANKNLSGVDSTIPYTEAALYSNNSGYTDELIFCAKTFPVRVKENTVSMVITWSITF